jgi:hypothetical protein
MIKINYFKFFIFFSDDMVMTVQLIWIVRMLIELSETDLFI